MSPLNLVLSDPKSVKVGKILTFARGCTLITSSTGSELQSGSYLVSNARVRGDAVYLSLNRAMQKPGGGFRVSREATIYKTTIAQLRTQYGFKVDRVSLMRGVITQIFKHEFKKAGHPEYIELLGRDNGWDTAFKNAGNGVINKLKGSTHIDESQRDDIILDALERLLRPGTVIKNFNSDRNDSLLGYLIYCFQLQVRTEVKNYKEEAANNVHNHTDFSHGEKDSDESLDDGVEADDDMDSSPHKSLEWKQLLKGFSDFIAKKSGKNRSKQLLEVLSGLLEGKIAAAIAEEMGMSKQAMFTLVKELRGWLLDFAKATKDSEMLSLLHKWGVTSAVGDSESESLADALLRLKRLRRGGKKTTVSIKTLGDLDSEDGLLDVLHSGSANSEDLGDLEDAFHANLAKFDDVIQGRDALMGLLQVSEE